MKTSDRYHKWVEWSEEDQTYLGKCPDLITGIHGDDPVQLYSELCEVVDEVLEQLRRHPGGDPARPVRPAYGDHRRARLQAGHHVSTCRNAHWI